ncbi:MAG TPA: hypothetical protein ENH82_06320 [bacterium]|nr:hypothetical protein [bacterium]
MKIFTHFASKSILSDYINEFLLYIDSKNPRNFSMKKPVYMKRISFFKSAVPCNIFCLLLMLLMFYFVPVSFSYAQENKNENSLMQELAVRVFLDISRRYQEHIIREIPYVNYVRDRKLAQVHILVTTQRTGSRGTEYTITFIGLQNFTAVNDTLIYVSNQMDTEETIRSGILETLKLGLVRYMSKTPQADYLYITYRKRAEPTEVIDKWDYWVFNVDTNSRLYGEEQRKSVSFRGSLSADRVTPDWKMSFNIGADYNRRDYEKDEGSISIYTRSQNFRLLVIKSLSEHWSTGLYGDAQSSIYRNIEFSGNIAPAIEYNLFPYSESTRREFRFLYRAGYTNVTYNEETIFNKEYEHLFDERLSATYEVKEEWGSVRSTLEGSHYFHNFGKNRVELNCNIDLRLTEGLSLDLYGSVSLIHDQLSLPKGVGTEEDILLRQREISTQYDYFTSIGLRYTFGSIYSNVVNSRFGSQRRFRGRF